MSWCHVIRWWLLGILRLVISPPSDVWALQMSGQCGEHRNAAPTLWVQIIRTLCNVQCTIGTQADTTRMMSRGLFLYFLMAPEAFLKGNCVKYMSRTLSTWSKMPKMSTKVLILTPEINVRLDSRSFPQCSVCRSCRPPVRRKSGHCLIRWLGDSSIVSFKLQPRLSKNWPLDKNVNSWNRLF